MPKKLKIKKSNYALFCYPLYILDRRNKLHIFYAWTTPEIILFTEKKEENLIYSNMNESNALNGKQKTLCIHILKVVAMNIDVSFLMAGKSKSIIHITIRCMHAGKESPVKNLIALISTKKVIKDIRSVHFLSISQETEGILLEEHIMHSINNTNQYS